MIKGFIEVTDPESGLKRLINVNWIEEIDNYTISLAFNKNYIAYKGTYEEIKQKIKEAVE